MTYVTPPEPGARTTRATRYVLEVALRYRRAGEDAWRDGISDNISRSGILFISEEPAPVDSAVEISFVLPAAPGCPSPARVACAGRVTRVVQPFDGRGACAIAASIDSYRLARDPD